MADLHNRAAWQDYRDQRQQVTQTVQRGVALDQARYYAALAQCAQSASFQIVLEHWVQVLWLMPDYSQVLTPQQRDRLFWKQAFLKEVLEEIRVAQDKSAAYAAEAARR